MFFDAHCDYLSLMGESRHITAESIKNGKIGTLCMAAFEGACSNFDFVRSQAKYFNRVELPVEKHLAFEGLGYIKKIDDVRWLTEQKPIYAGLMWNNENLLGGSCYYDASVTGLGKAVIKELEKNGIAVDLAHAGEKMFFSCVDEGCAPLVSHANVKCIYEHVRNLSDRQVRTVIDRHGFMGITFFKPFVGEEGTIAELFAHIEHVLMLGGEFVLGFGSDLDGCDCLAGNYTDCSIYARIYDEMLKRNFSAKLINGLMEENAKSFFKI